MAQIVCSDLQLGYEGKIILTGVNFEVNAGDYLCIIGENGSGKSTLMKAVLSLISPMGGSISYGDGIKSTDIGYLPQQTFAQKDFPASVEEIVMSGFCSKMGIRPFYTGKEREIAKTNMERMGVADLRSESYKNLSGGQQQRVLLARALCAAKKILLLDEPVSGLDPNVTSLMYELIHELNHKDGITIIMITHDVAATYQYASHILHIGDDVTFGTKDEYQKGILGKAYRLMKGGKHDGRHDK